MSPMIPTSRTKKLRAESLESRVLLAGDVTADVVDGDLLLWGDHLSNHVSIRSGEVDGTFIIRGLEIDNDGGTTVNGEKVIRVGGVDGDVEARMWSGDDTVYIHEADLPGNLLVRSSVGADRVLIGGHARTSSPAITAAPVAIDGADLVGVEEPVDPVPVPSFPNVTIDGNVRIDTSRGDDAITMGNVRITGNLNVKSGSGSDVMRLGFNQLPITEPISDVLDAPDVASTASALPISAPLFVRGSMGVDAGSGSDQLWTQSLRVGNDLKVDLGTGDDAFAMNRAKIQTHIEVEGSRGGDRIALVHAFADSATIRTGAGDDGLGIIRSNIDHLFANLGVGDDRMVVEDLTAVWAWLDGGAEDDKLELRGTNDVTTLVVLGFEDIS